MCVCVCVCVYMCSCACVYLACTMHVDLEVLESEELVSVALTRTLSLSSLSGDRVTLLSLFLYSSARSIHSASALSPVRKVEL